MTIKEQYHFFLSQLQTIYNPGEAAVITERIFESLAGCKRFDIVKQPGKLLPDLLIEKLQTALHALLQHKPVQYVTGEAWFYKMKFKVNENVLIPRPETEELVKLFLDGLPCNASASLSVLDIGTGSGCIAIVIKTNLPSATVTAIDISSNALDVAKENAAAYNAEINFLEVNFLDETLWGALPVYDIIISNPPYIPLQDKESMDKNVTACEPHQALFVPDDAPLLFYKKIAAFAGTHLNKKGKIFMETNERFAAETAALFVPGFNKAIIEKDIFGKERMVVITY